ncbi:hypothetical protein FJZ33_00010 [Candidatus Poribacteria bacterium]|nr:hypothetical protein [Candidatus Poribacteria bacterium]
MIGIYIIKNKINHKIYVGQTTDFDKRIKQHRKNAIFNKHKIYNRLYPAIKKYGINNFEFIFIENCKIEQLNEKEIQYIQKFNSYNNGYNATKGGNNRIAYWKGKHRSKTTKRKIAKNLTNQKQSLETKIKRGASLKKFWSKIPFYNRARRKCPVICIETKEEFATIKEAAKKINRHPTVILGVLKGKRKTAGNYHWERKE